MKNTKTNQKYIIISMPSKSKTKLDTSNENVVTAGAFAFHHFQNYKRIAAESRV